MSDKLTIHSSGIYCGKTLIFRKRKIQKGAILVYITDILHFKLSL
jgi:hypothetical protein